LFEEKIEVLVGEAYHQVLQSKSEVFGRISLSYQKLRFLLSTIYRLPISIGKCHRPMDYVDHLVVAAILHLVQGQAVGRFGFPYLPFSNIQGLGRPWRQRVAGRHIAVRLAWPAFFGNACHPSRPQSAGTHSFGISG